MEEILASIKRIIADDGIALNGSRPRLRAETPPPAAPPVADSPVADPPVADPIDADPPLAVLELTESVAPPAATPPAPLPTPPSPPVADEAAPAVADPQPTLVSDDAACASRQSLSTLSSMVLRAPGNENTLDGLVRELLRPLLKEWLDARLPDLVESLVAREIARITGKAL